MRSFACVGGGSNAIGMFHAFIGDESVKLIGVEAGGRSAALGEHAARFSGGAPGVLHGTFSYLIAGCRRPGRADAFGFGRSGLRDGGAGTRLAARPASRRVYFRERCRSARRGVTLARTEGIIPALESAHAIAEVIKRAPERKGQIVRGEPFRARRQRHRHLSREFTGTECRLEFKPVFTH